MVTKYNPKIKQFKPHLKILEQNENRHETQRKIYIRNDYSLQQGQKQRRYNYQITLTTGLHC